jgi:L-ascorbate metabolism protein UlaG (beta-lactamase superfamily)
VLSGSRTTVLLDPFLTRPSLLRTATMPLEPTPDRWYQRIPAKVDAVLVGHSHYDHLMDAPIIARLTGATIVGSASTAAFARAAGVAEDRIVVVPPEGREIVVGDATIRFVPSLHGRIVAGRVPLPGDVRGVPHVPARLWDYRMGGAFGVRVGLDGVRVYHNGSADLIDAEIEGAPADVLLVGLAGRQGTRDYLSRLVRLLSPKLVVPTHHDAFFAPLEAGARLLPRIDFDGFLSEMKRIAPSVRVITPGYDDVAILPRDGGLDRTVLVNA